MSFDDSKINTAEKDNHIDNHIPPPPPYEDHGVTSIPKTHPHFDQETVTTGNIRPFIQPSAPPQVYNEFHPRVITTSGTPAPNDFASNRLINDPELTFVTNNKDKKPRNCFVRYWSVVLNRNAWASCVYILLISPVISTFAFFWILCTFIGAVISVIFPPVGFFLCIATAWSWRALGRLELLTVQLCTIATPTPSYSTRKPFNPIIHLSCANGLLSYGGALFSDLHTWMCFLYFIFVKSILMFVASVLVFHLFILAFSPFMILMMPALCWACKKIGEQQVEIAEKFLLRRRRLICGNLD